MNWFVLILGLHTDVGAQINENDKHVKIAIVTNSNESRKMTFASRKMYETEKILVDLWEEYK